MNRFVISSLLVFIMVCNSCAGTGTVYVSSSIGADSNSGTIEKPLKTIGYAIEHGDSIFLKRGDVFYENLKIDGKYLGAYGKGNKPEISGYKRFVKPQWINAGENLWKIALVGGSYSGFNTNGSSLLNDACAIHEYDKDSIHGNRKQYLHQLNADWDTWQTEKYGDGVVKPTDYDTLYLYLSQDPNNLKLEFAVGTAGIVAKNSTIEDIAFIGWGFGMSIGANTVVRRCVIDAIGGWQSPGGSHYVVYGNGIEIYCGNQPVNNIRITDNIVSRCYDCGISIQGDVTKKEALPKDIIVENNFIYQCAQAWESFLRPKGSKHALQYENCYFRNNTVVNSGLTSGFGYYDNRFKFCHVLSNNYTGSTGMVIENNTFVGGNYYCAGGYNGKYSTNTWRGNKCYIKRGDFILSNYEGTADVIRIPMEGSADEAIKRYRELTGDKTTKFIIKDEEDVNKRMKRLMKKMR